MKTIIYIITITLSMGINTLNAQEIANDTIEIPYTFFDEFTGVVLNEFDSIFVTYLVFDANDLADVKQIMLEDNKRIIPYNLNSNNPGITSENGKIFLKLEGINLDPEFFKIKFEDQEGKKYKTKLNVKY